MTSAMDREVSLRCEAVLARATLVLARRDPAAFAGLPEPGARLAQVEAALADVPTDGVVARIADRLGLDRIQTGFLWATIATGLEPSLPVLLDDLVRGTSSLGLSVAAFAALAELPPGAARALAAWLSHVSNPLVTTGLVARHRAEAPAPLHAFVPSPRLLGAVLSDARPSDGVRTVARVDRRPLDDAQRAADAHLQRVIPSLGDRDLLVVEGATGSGRRTAIAHAAGRAVVCADASAWTAASLGSAFTALQREAFLLDAIPVIAGLDELAPDLRSAADVAITAWPGPLVVTARAGMLHLATTRTTVRVSWPLPGPALRATLWRELGGLDEADQIATIAHRFPVGAGLIQRAAASARLLHGDEPACAAHLIEGLRHNLAEHTGAIARRVEVTQTLDDLVVEDDLLEEIQALIARARLAPQVLETWGYKDKLARGTGIAALLSGPPGTGKSMTAGIIARELGLELYQVDLSQVVSKWQGETEKNLARLFDAAEAGDMLLLFDEADAMFSQRTSDVKSSNDRNANLEVNYLLQRVEAFGGITILTTNLETAIDPALKRRLAAHIEFQDPDEDERTRLWERLARTATAPLGRDLDFEDLSRRFEKMTGANIRNAVIKGAFLAAAEASPTIDHRHFARAAQAVYYGMGNKLGRSTTL